MGWKKNSDPDPEPHLPEGAGKGPCLFGAEHKFKTIVVHDPFTNKDKSLPMCEGCGLGSGG